MDEPAQGRPVARWARSSSTSPTRRPARAASIVIPSPSRSAARTGPRPAAPRPHRALAGDRRRQRQAAAPPDRPCGRTRARQPRPPPTRRVKAATARSALARAHRGGERRQLPRPVSPRSPSQSTNTGGSGPRRAGARAAAASVAAPPLPMVRGAVTSSTPRGAAGRAVPSRGAVVGHRHPGVRGTPRGAASRVAPEPIRLLVGRDDDDGCRRLSSRPHRCYRSKESARRGRGRGPHHGHRVEDRGRQVGDAVEEGDTVVILESMKMEMPVEAEDEGTVTEILSRRGRRCPRATRSLSSSDARARRAGGRQAAPRPAGRRRRAADDRPTRPSATRSTTRSSTRSPRRVPRPGRALPDPHRAEGRCSRPATTSATCPATLRRRRPRSSSPTRSTARIEAMEAYAYPTVAALNGHAIGGGLELALSLRPAAGRRRHRSSGCRRPSSGSSTRTPACASSST